MYSMSRFNIQLNRQTRCANKRLLYEASGLLERITRLGDDLRFYLLYLSKGEWLVIAGLAVGSPRCDNELGDLDVTVSPNLKNDRVSRSALDEVEVGSSLRRYVRPSAVRSTENGRK